MHLEHSIEVSRGSNGVYWKEVELFVGVYAMDEFVDAANMKNTQHFQEWFQELKAREECARFNVAEDEYSE